MVKRVLFNIYVAFNMLVCSLFFLPWAMPRETVSGLLGRWLQTETGTKLKTARIIGQVVDRIYFWERNHCIETYKVERDARRILYS